jgi:hypothetical protein
MSNPYVAMSNPYAASPYGAADPYASMGMGANPYGAMAGTGGMDSYAAAQQPSQGPTQSGAFKLNADGSVSQAGQQVKEGSFLPWLALFSGLTAGAVLLLKGKGKAAEEAGAAVEDAAENATPKHIEIKDGDAASGSEAV